VVYLAYPALADRCKDFVRTELASHGQWHRDSAKFTRSGRLWPHRGANIVSVD
jgi:hypothetical protein